MVLRKAPQRIRKTTRPTARPIGQGTVLLFLVVILWISSIASVMVNIGNISAATVIALDIVAVVVFMSTYPLYFIWRNWLVLAGLVVVIVGSLAIGAFSLFYFYPMLVLFLLWFVFHILTASRYYDDSRYVDRPDSEYFKLRAFAIPRWKH